VQPRASLVESSILSTSPSRYHPQLTASSNPFGDPREDPICRRLMASATVTTSALHPSHRASFSASVSTAVADTFDHHTNSLAAAAAMPSSSQQSQPPASSQQSFTLSQPSSQQAAMAGSSFRQFSDSAARLSDEPPQIYSVSSFHLLVQLGCGR
jgi:hypothetical protein